MPWSHFLHKAFSWAGKSALRPSVDGLLFHILYRKALCRRWCGERTPWKKDNTGLRPINTKVTKDVSRASVTLKEIKKHTKEHQMLSAVKIWKINVRALYFFHFLKQNKRERPGQVKRWLRRKALPHKGWQILIYHMKGKGGEPLFHFVCKSSGHWIRSVIRIVFQRYVSCGAVWSTRHASGELQASPPKKK